MILLSKYTNVKMLPIAVNGILIIVLLLMLTLSLPFIFLTFFLFFVGVTFLSLKKDTYLVIVFCVFYTFYLMSVLFSELYLFTILDTQYIYKDESTFYNLTKLAANKIESGKGLDYFIFNYDYHKFPLFVYLNGWLHILTERLGASSLLIHKVPIVFCCAFIPVFIYVALVHYIPKKKAVIASLFFGFGCFLPYFTLVYMRDMPVAFLYAFFFTLFLINNNKLLRVFGMLTLIVLVFLIRKENGLYLAVILSCYPIYILNDKIKSKIFKVLMCLVFIVMVLGVFTQIGLVERVLEIYVNTAAHAEKGNSGASLSMILSKLPYGVGYPFIIMFTQIQPFPIALYLTNTNEIMLHISYVLSGLLWFYIISLLVVVILKERKFNMLPLKVRYLFYSIIPYILIVGSTEGVTRRLFPVYFVLFAVTVILNQNKSKIYFKLIFICSMVFITILNVFYYFLGV